MSNSFNELLGNFEKEKHSLNPLLDKAHREQIDTTNYKDKRKTGRNNSWQVTELQELHHAIKRMIFLGAKNIDIADTLNCSPGLISSVRNSPIIKDELALMNASADTEVITLQTRVSKLAPKALENIEECINKGTVNNDPVDVKLILAECNKVIDRDMGKPSQNITSQNTHLHFTPEDLDRIKTDAMKNCTVVDINKDSNEL